MARVLALLAALAGTSVRAQTPADDADQAPALHEAAKKGDAVLLKKLVSEGADVNEADGDGLTPLMAAVLAGQQGAVDALLGAGADPNALDNEGETALIKACRPPGPKRLGKPQRAKLVKALLKAKADPKIRSESRYAALVGAVVSNNPEMVRALLDAKADPFVTTPKGKDILSLAKQRGYREVAELLRQARGWD